MVCVCTRGGRFTPLDRRLPGVRVTATPTLPVREPATGRRRGFLGFAMNAMNGNDCLVSSVRTFVVDSNLGRLSADGADKSGVGFGEGDRDRQEIEIERARWRTVDARRIPVTLP